jgi:hypothetical protein
MSELKLWANSMFFEAIAVTSALRVIRGVLASVAVLCVCGGAALCASKAEKNLRRGAHDFLFSEGYD